MKHSARSLSEMFTKQIPKTDNSQEYQLYEQVRDRLASVAYRLVRDIPDNTFTSHVVYRLLDAQVEANKAIHYEFHDKE